MASEKASASSSVPNPFVLTPYIIEKRSAETADTTTLVMVPANGGQIPAFKPGQFNMLYSHGVGEAAISVSGDPKKRDKLTHTIRAVGKITNALTSLEPGSVVGVRGPYGVSWPMEEMKHHDVVVVGGGLGLAPLRPALYDLINNRSQYERIEVMYGARSPKDIVYNDEIQRWRAIQDWRFQVTVDAAGREWYGDVGVVTTRIPDARFDPKNTVALVCGPDIMMKFVIQSLTGRGIPDDRIYVSLERNMKCAVGFCGHCQYGPIFVCRDGPVFKYSDIKSFMFAKEV
jgi:NAD(P)H-flavin reductase